MFNCLTITSSLVVFMVSFSLSRFLSQVTKKVPFLEKYFNFKKYPRQSLICLRYLLDNMNNYIIPDT